MKRKRSTKKKKKQSKTKNRDIKPTEENIEKLKNDIKKYREFGKHMITILGTWSTIFLAVLNIPILILKDSINFNSGVGISFIVLSIITIGVLLVSIAYFIYVFLPTITSYDDDVKIRFEHYKKEDQEKREMLRIGLLVYAFGYLTTFISIILLVVLII